MSPNTHPLHSVSASHIWRRERGHKWLIVAVVLVFFGMPATVRAVSSWNPTLIVNTEAFQTIDAGDGSTDEELRFGDGATRLFYRISSTRFEFTKPLWVQGDLTATGSITTTNTLSGRTLRVGVGGAKVHGTLSVTGSILSDGNMSGATLEGAGLYDCDTAASSKLLWNVSTKTFSCGSDQSGGVAVDVQSFTATGTWTKTTGVTVTRIQLWGGGGSGGRGGSNDAGGGGGGGSYLDVLVSSSTLAATETCGVGAGGSAATADEANGELGGHTTFDVFTAYGGGPGFGATTTNGGGGGGACPFADGAIGTNAAGGVGGCGATAGVDDYLGGGGGTVNGGDSGVGGGGGGLGITSGTEGAGGKSVYGGGGGGGADGAATPSATGGDSLYGGDGGIGSTSTTVATSGSQPGGGGGGSESANSGAGGDGKCIITSW